MPDDILSRDPLPPEVASPATAEPPRATAFIVTIYGDVAEPRGGTLGMATLIDCCAAHGISETLVRTAVSRLVGAGQLEGERIGRRSHYRLTSAAQAEFGRAAQVLYAPPPEPTGWLMALGETALPARDWVRIGPAAALAPDRSDVARPAGAALISGEAVEDTDALARFAARHWPLDEVGSHYAAFVAEFAPFEALVEDGVQHDDAGALALRLRLVHTFRMAALSDPRLPRAAWPEGWLGAEARRLFVRLYLALTESADRHIGRVFEDPDGLLPEETAATRRRLDRLRREAAR